MNAGKRRTSFENIKLSKLLNFREKTEQNSQSSFRSVKNEKKPLHFREESAILRLRKRLRKRTDEMEADRHGFYEGYRKGLQRFGRDRQQGPLRAAGHRRADAGADLQNR